MSYFQLGREGQNGKGMHSVYRQVNSIERESKSQYAWPFLSSAPYLNLTIIPLLWEGINKSL